MKKKKIKKQNNYNNKFEIKNNHIYLGSIISWILVIALIMQTGFPAKLNSLLSDVINTKSNTSDIEKVRR